MKIFNNKIINKYPFILKNTLYFDIETTGFINTDAHIYMIGMFFLENNFIEYEFLFAENKNSEEEIIHHFFEKLNSFEQICTFNGSTFDIPFIKWRCSSLNLNYTFNDKLIFDMYKEFKPYKQFLSLTRLKQKNFEEFLGLKRQDKFNGGELITLYRNYSKTHDERLEKIISLHNINDLEGMAELTNIYGYINPQNWSFTATKIQKNYFEILFESKISIHSPISHSKDDFLFEMHKKNIKISLPLESSEKKYFFKNHKEYYYLPIEDMAIHKSVGKFVDTKNRIQASKKNAYTKKFDTFIKLPFYSYDMFLNDIDDSYCYSTLDNIKNLNVYEVADKIIDLFSK